MQGVKYLDKSLVSGFFSFTKFRALSFRTTSFTIITAKNDKQDARAIAIK